MDNEDTRYASQFIGRIIMSVLLFVIIVSLGLFALPKYRVWQRGLNGQAQLKEQEYAKQIIVEQAKAELEGASLYAEAEVARAKGVAESMSIISGGLEDNTSYLQYLAIQAQMKMAESPNHTTVYIPVGASGIPLIKEIK